MSLEGKVALVTGAGSHGIGRAIAVRLAEAGADVAVHGFGDPVGATELAEEIGNLGRRSLVLMADLSQPANGRQLVQQAIAGLGQLDILVNNAGTVIRKTFFEVTDDDFETLLAVNLKSYFACAQEAAAHMVQRRAHDARIIMISSANQQIVVRGQACYCATKGGVMQLARAMALELAEHNVTVNLVAPGTIETDFNRHLLQDPAFRRLREAPIPMGRVGSPEDIAGAVAFLAGKEASYITGATIVADGGLSLP